MRLSRMIAVAGFVSALALPMSAQADVMMTTSSSGATTTGGTTSSTKASTGAGTGSGSTGTGGGGGAGSDSGSSSCAVQPGQTAGAIGLAAIPALALIVLRLRRRKAE